MRMRFTAAAAAISALVGLTTPAIHAQGRAAQPGPRAAATPAAAPDLKKVLYNAADALGMLRGAQEVDRVATMKYWAAGTMTVNGQAYKVTTYVGSMNFHVAGLRADITRTAPDGMSQRVVEVVSDKFAWNETQPGMNATPAPGTAAMRLLQLWMLPPGVVKAATAAGANAKVGLENGSTVLTFPIASLGATMKATLDAKNFITQVEAKMGSAAVAAVTVNYSDYGDWNGDDYLSDVMFPRHIVQKVGGVTVLDLTVSKTNSYNPYVVMPVPDNIEKAAPQSAVAR
jgi:hypothetical protein